VKILVYGGAFNPIHKGHINIIECACEYLEIDKLIIVPNKLVHFKSNDNVVSFDRRVDMINLALKDININCDIEISDLEDKQEDTTYTIDLIKLLKDIYVNDKFYFLIGSDHVSKLNQWKDIDLLKKEVEFVVAKREENFVSDEFIVINNEVVTLSSTDIRDNYESTAIEEVDIYIRYYGLYLNDLLKSYLKEKRIIHSNNVATLARKYALKYHLDENKAYVAGMLHDIAKDIPLDKQYELVKNDKVFECHDATVHAFSAVHIVKDVLNIKDEDILEAIKWHTTAYFKMAPLSKLIYCCDMVSADRDYQGVEELRKLLEVDLNECFKQCFLASYDFLLAKNIVISKELVELKENVERNDV
jgi:nicotinate-nucleotide adenylyltransferase